MENTNVILRERVEDQTWSLKQESDFGRSCIGSTAKFETGLRFCAILLGSGAEIETGLRFCAIMLGS